MAKILTIHSFCRGVGRSSFAANIAALMASTGKRVCLVDAHLHSPSLHILFNLETAQVAHTLNDYLWECCSIEQTVQNVTLHLEQTNSPTSGQLFLIPASGTTSDITRGLRTGYTWEHLTDGFQRLISLLQLDFIILDTSSGLNEETLFLMAIADKLSVLLRPDQQEYHGTAVSVDVAKTLDVPDIGLIVNEVPANLDPDDVRREVESVYECPVLAVLPYADEHLVDGQGIFVLNNPEHPNLSSYQAVLKTLLE